MNRLPAGWRLEAHDLLPSTADLLRRRAEAGEGAGLAILARSQSAGRGTLGRRWASPPGNLYLSLLLRPDTAARDVPQWALLAAVAVWEALAPHAGPGLTLKWPNDLLIRGAKCAGILTESSLAPDGRLAWIGFGIGANLAQAPDVPGRATAALPPPAPSARDVATTIIARIEHWRGVQSLHGFAPVREAWMARGHALGEPIRTTVAQGKDGVFAGLDEDGALLIRTARGTERMVSGELETPWVPPGAAGETIVGR